MCMCAFVLNDYNKRKKTIETTEEWKKESDRFLNAHKMYTF